MRRADWQPRLWATLKAADARPFYYGACAMLAAECVDAMTDANWREAIAPLIESAKSQPVTLEQLEAFVTERIGEPIAINWTNQGDVVLLDLPQTGAALAICTGHLVACARIPAGVAYLKLHKARRAWRIA